MRLSTFALAVGLCAAIPAASARQPPPKPAASSQPDDAQLKTLEAKLAKKLGREAKCPHGNYATPETPTVRRKRGWKLLSEAPVDAQYFVASVYERDRKLLEFLEERGMRPGAKLKVLARNYDQTITLETDEGKSAVGKPVAERVWVKPAKSRD